jgi:hypothetical protein
MPLLEPYYRRLPLIAAPERIAPPAASSLRYHRRCTPVSNFAFATKHHRVAQMSRNHLALRTSKTCAKTELYGSVYKRKL